MTTLTDEKKKSRAYFIQVTDDSLMVDLEDGRSITVPLTWFPRLLHGNSKERSNWKLIGKGEGIHWPDLDEDISVENLIKGYPSGESQSSFKKWLSSRPSKNKCAVPDSRINLS